MGSVIEVAMSPRQLLDTDPEEDPADSPLHRVLSDVDLPDGEGYEPTTPTASDEATSPNHGERPTST